MEIEFTLKAEEDVDFWKKSGNKLILKKIRKLLENIKDNPFEGIGRPEQLRYDWVGYWSRRINHEHRLIYEVRDNKFSFIHLGSL